MTKTIDSLALIITNQMLGLAGDSPGEVLLDDKNVSQVLGVNEVARRGLAGPSTGLYIGLFENAHGAGATELSSTINPYAVGDALRRTSFPARVPPGLELWLLSVTGRITAITFSNFSEAFFFINDPATHVGFGVDDGGSAGGAGVGRAVARWDAAVNQGGTPLITEAGEASVWVGQRLREGTSLQFSSSASNAVTVQGQALLGLFPIGLGQDVVT